MSKIDDTPRKPIKVRSECPDPRTRHYLNLKSFLISNRTSGIEPVYQEHYVRQRVGCNRGIMPVKSMSTLEEIKNVLSSGVGSHELVFVNGKPYEGEVSFNRYKGFGWESGRTASVYVKPEINPASEVLLVDLRYLRLRRCVLAPQVRPEWHQEGEQEWVAIDLPEDKK